MNSPKNNDVNMNDLRYRFKQTAQTKADKREDRAYLSPMYVQIRDGRRR